MGWNEGIYNNYLKTLTNGSFRSLSLSEDNIS